MVYYKCTNACYFKVKYIIKQNLLDILFNRSLKEKTENYCHYICLKELQMENIKRNGRWGFCPVFGMTEFSFVSSTLFHIHENCATRFMDYFCAVLDIPPYSYILDSHAIWHFFGILSTPFYVKFWGDDIKHHRLLYNNIKMKKKKKQTILNCLNNDL
ncbi:hypothetical protein NAPIS_ORF00363 [Vairimorpha apis BRL 01]|uniref:Post-GPI attachment to proteins factor 3 n=1 Tax=Vairimorpha apis BRL 01 TaxID=1037528 RepID=T0LCK8_9MICR|nr:hypothetical protein NAPIS_ORF00363 [Vairimorpha apis BRL 01]